MSADDFQSKYASVMESMLKSAVAETTKLFETMVDELKAEISKIKKENEDLKTRCSQFEKARSKTPVDAGESEPLPGTVDSCGKRDTAVQCELVPLRTMLVEQCQPFMDSSLQNQEQQWRYDEMEYGLQEHNYVIHREIKQEDDDCFLQSTIKQEEEEHCVVCDSVVSDKEGSQCVSLCETKDEEFHTDQEYSSGELPSPQKREETLNALELSLFEIDGDLQGIQNQESDAEDSCIQDQPETSLKISNIRTEAELLTTDEQPLAAVQHKSEIESFKQCRIENKKSVSEQTKVSLQQSVDVQCKVKEVADPTPQNKEVIIEERKTDTAEGEASYQLVRRRRGRPPKRAKHLQQPAKEVQLSTGVTAKQNDVTSPSRIVKMVQVCAFESLNTSPVKSKKTGEKEGENPSYKGAKKSKVSAANTPPIESKQSVSLRTEQRRTSVTLQDAMLLVEAMNQSTVENGLSSPQEIAEQPQTQCASSVATLQSVDKNTTVSQTQMLPDISQKTSGQLPTSKQPTVDTLDITPRARGSIPNNKTLPYLPVVKAKHQHVVTSSNTAASPVLFSGTASQTRVVSLKKHSVHPLITALAQSKGINTAPQKIIVVPRSTSIKLPALVAGQNTSLLAVSTAPSLPCGTTSHSPVVQRIYVSSEKLHSLGASHSSPKSRDQQLETPPPHKITIIIPRSSQTVVLKTMQDSAKSEAPVKFALPHLSLSSQESNILLDDQTTSDETATLSAQKRDSSSKNLESAEQSTSLFNITTTPTKTGTGLKRSFGKMPASVFPLVQQKFQPKQSAMVRLTRLPFPVSTKESVLVSKLLSNGTSETRTMLTENTQNKPPSAVISTQPSGIKVSTGPKLKANSVAESQESNDVQGKVTTSEANVILKDSHGRNLLPPSISSKVSALAFEESAVATRTTEPLADESALYLDEHIFSDAVQNDGLPNNPQINGNESTAPIQLTAVISKDTSDPHLQMTKAQFLAQLAVSPVAQPSEKVSASDFEDETTSDKKSSLVARLRSHLKFYSQARKAESNPDLCRETETTTVSPKKPRLENAHQNDKSTNEPIPLVENVTSINTTTADTNYCAPISPVGSELCKDDVHFESVCELTSVASRWSKVTSESTTVRVRSSSSGKDRNEQFSYVSPRRCSSSKDGASPKNIKSTSVSPKRTGSNTDGASPKKTKSSSVSPKRTSSPRNGTSPKNTKSTSVSPKRIGSTRDGTSLKTTRSTSVSPKISNIYRRSAFTKVGPNTKPIKTESNSFSPKRCNVTTNSAVTKKAKIETASPSSRWHELAKDGVSPRRTGESTPARRPRLSLDIAGPKKNLSVLNAKKLAKAAKAKTVAKMKTSQQPKLQNGAKSIQLADNQTVKKCKTTAVWIPPRMPISKIPKKEIRSQDHKAIYSPSASLPPIPVKAPPIVSPLQPLSVIGGRLLKNQCGECGRVLSSSAALESHVGLHTGRRPFSCTLCGKSFPDLKGLKRHGRVHRNGRIHVCPQCGKGFVYRFGLTKHLQMVHGRLKPFVCQICNKGFYTKKDVEAHIRIHTGEKPFHCNLCDKRFTRRVELNVHLRWHNGEKRHWCPYCGKGFLDFNNLKRHKYIHTGEKPHSCPHCPKHFTQSGHLKKHVKNVHKIE